MDYLYTKNGRPLKLRGEDLFNSSGTHVGRIKSGKVFDSRGKYLATVMRDRLVYRSVHRSSTGSSFSPPSRIMGFSRINRVPSAIMGEEPQIPE